MWLRRPGHHQLFSRLEIVSNHISFVCKRARTYPSSGASAPLLGSEARQNKPAAKNPTRTLWWGCATYQSVKWQTGMHCGFNLLIEEVGSTPIDHHPTSRQGKGCSTVITLCHPLSAALQVAPAMYHLAWSSPRHAQGTEA